MYSNIIMQKHVRNLMTYEKWHNMTFQHIVPVVKSYKLAALSWDYKECPLKHYISCSAVRLQNVVIGIPFAIVTPRRHTRTMPSVESGIIWIHAIVVINATSDTLHIVDGDIDVVVVMITSKLPF